MEDILKLSSSDGAVYIRKSAILAVRVYAHRGGIVPLAQVIINGATINLSDPIDDVIKKLA